MTVAARSERARGAAIVRSESLRPAATWLMALALACAPAYTVRFHAGPLPTTLLEVLLVVAIAAGLATYWEEIPWRNPFTWPALVFLLGATLDVWFAPDHRAAAGLWKAYFIEPALAGLVVAAMAPRHWRLFLLALGIGALVPALANIAVEGSALATGTFNERTPQVAIYNSANAIPLFLEPLAAFALAIAVHGPVRRDRIVAAGFFAVYALAILTSFSRLGWITLIVLCLFVAAFHRLRWVAFAAAVLAAIALFAVSHRVRDRILVEFDFSSRFNTLAIRFPLWRASLDMLRDHPLFGGGLAGFKAAIVPYAKREGYGEDLIYPHNLLLNTWTETGLLGLIGFLGTLVQALRLGLRRLREDAWGRALGIGLLGVLLTFAVHGIGDVPYFKNDQALAFWALLGVTLGAGRATDNP